MRDRKERFYVYLLPDDKKWLDQYCEKEHYDRSEFVRRLIIRERKAIENKEVNRGHSGID